MAELAGELLEDAFATLVDEEMLSNQLDPKALSPGLMERTYEGFCGILTITELSSRTGLKPDFLLLLAQAGKIPGAQYVPHIPQASIFFRDKVIPWLMSYEPQKLYAGNPQHHLPKP